MHTARSPTVHASVATNTSGRGGGAGSSSEQVWIGLQWLLPDGTSGKFRPEPGGPHVWCPREVLYSEVNASWSHHGQGHMRILQPYGQNDGRTGLKTLSSPQLRWQTVITKEIKLQKSDIDSFLVWCKFINNRGGVLALGLDWDDSSGHSQHLLKDASL